MSRSSGWEGLGWRDSLADITLELSRKDQASSCGNSSGGKTLTEESHTHMEAMCQNGGESPSLRRVRPQDAGERHGFQTGGAKMDEVCSPGPEPRKFKTGADAMAGHLHGIRQSSCVYSAEFTVGGDDGSSPGGSLAPGRMKVLPAKAAAGYWQLDAQDSRRHSDGTFAHSGGSPDKELAAGELGSYSHTGRWIARSSTFKTCMEPLAGHSHRRGFDCRRARIALAHSPADHPWLELQDSRGHSGEVSSTDFLRLTS
ncbi:hypothetical protein V8D89_015404 [Ganoderma adspersum]